MRGDVLTPNPEPALEWPFAAESNGSILNHATAHQAAFNQYSIGAPLSNPPLKGCPEPTRERCKGLVPKGHTDLHTPWLLKMHPRRDLPPPPLEPPDVYVTLRPPPPPVVVLDSGLDCCGEPVPTLPLSVRA